MKAGALRLCSWLLPALYLSYYIATTSFYHVHNFNGSIIVHSHFHAFNLATPAKSVQHTHTTAQINAIAALMDIVLSCIVGLTVFFAAIGLRKLFVDNSCRTACLRAVELPPRAPPHYCIL